MELRVLKYFLTVAREQNITNAAGVLHITQPTLSRQLKELEEELGVDLLVRGNKNVTLTEEGILFRKRAEEILSLTGKAINEVKHSQEDVSGDIYIGGGETEGIRSLVSVMREMSNRYPAVRFHLNSGDKMDIIEKLDKGLIDFGLFLDPIDKAKYNFIKIPAVDTLGILARKDSVLGKKEFVTAKDLKREPLILSRQMSEDVNMLRLLETTPEQIHVVATYNLIFNASILVEEGMGYALVLDKIINTTGDSPLTFIPLKPGVHVEMYLLWKKYQVFPKAASVFLDSLQELEKEHS